MSMLWLNSVFNAMSTDGHRDLIYPLYVLRVVQCPVRRPTQERESELGWFVGRAATAV